MNTLADLTTVASLPSIACQNGTTYNLYNYINLTSGVTFTVDGSAATSTFDPASYSTGSHTLGASFPFDNGTTTVSLGSINVYSLPAVTTNPANTTICNNQAASFSAGGSGSAISYQWQVNTGSGFANTPAGSPYSGTTTSTLSINPVVSSMAGYQYQCVISNSCSSATTSFATLGVYGQISIIGNPSNSSVCPNASTSFTANGSGGTGTISYQWQQSGDGGASWSNLTNGVGTNAVISGATTNTLGLASILGTYSGYQFRCVFSDACPGNADQNASASATLTVNTNVGIATQPTSTQTLCPGAAFNLSVTANGQGPYSYQWYKGASAITTAISSTYSIASVSSTDAATYSVTVGGGCGSAVTSSNAVLAIDTNVGISAQPTASTTLCPGGAYNLSVTASGTSPYTYQWYKGITAITGATSSTYSIASVASTDAATYKVVVGGVCGVAVTSSNAVLTINTNVGIATQPSSSSSLCPGNTYNLSVVASGTSPYTYQWNKNGSAIGGATGSTYSISSVAAADAATYTVTVSGSCGNPVTSSNASLTVNTNVGISSQPIPTQTLCPGATFNLSVTPSGTSPFTYQWNKNGTAISGATASAFSIASIAASDAATYTVTVGGACGSPVTSTSAALVVNTNVGISSQPVASQTLCPGATFNLSVTPSGTSPFTYQWKKNGTAISGATASAFSIASVAAADVANYTVTVSGVCGSPVTSNNAALVLYSAVTITQQPVNSKICQLTNASFTAAATTPIGSVTYQWWVNPGTGTFVAVGSTPIYSGATSNTLTLTNPPLSYSGYQYYVVASNGCASLSAQSSTVNLSFYSTLPVTTAPANQNVCPNSAVTFAVVASANTGSLTYQWQVNTGSGFANVPSSAPYGASGTTATLNISSAPVSMSGYLYRVIVNDGCGASTQYTSPSASLTVNNSVGITTDLAASTSPCVNGTMSLSVTASGAGITYQWQENSGSSWANIANVGIYSGALTNSLSISSVPLSYNGYKYRMQIVGTCSSTTSAITTVSIIVPPTITNDPTSSVVCSGTPASFSVAASGTLPTYQWQFSTSGSVGTFTNISGATGTTYSIASAAASNGGYYRATVSNGCGSNFSNAAQLTVRPVTSIATQPASIAVCPTASTSFTVAGAGTGPFSYSWQVSTNSGNSWSPITNTGVYSGATTSTLSLATLTVAYNSYQYQATVNGSCGSPVVSTAAELTVNPTPTAPTVIAPSICGTGLISTTASSLAPTPTYNWYLNQSDVLPTYTGATYTVSSLSVTTTYYATVVSLTCESAKQQVDYTVNTPTSVGLGGALTLCLNQGKYDLSKDIVQTNSTGGTFSWKDANNVSYSGNFFDPTIGVGTYTITYVPPSSVQVSPSCYITSQRTVTVISSSGSAGISFLAPTGSPVVNSGNSINTCAGDNALNLSDYTTPVGGSWQTLQGNGISGNGSSVIFTPSINNLTTPSLPNQFQYTVSIGGCTGSAVVTIFVSNNTANPVLSGLPAVVCPGANLNIGATVNTTGTFDYNWYNGKNALASTGASFSYKVTKDTTLYVRSVNTPFGCVSPATLVNVVTPFSSGLIGVDKSSIAYGDKVDFTYTGSTNGISYLWNFGDGGFPSTDQNPEHPFYKSGTFTINLTLASTLNCSKTLSYSSVVVAGPDVNVITGDTGPQYHGLNVFPIPVKDQLSITSENSLCTVTVYDLQGRPLVVKECAGLYETSISTGSLASGMYILLVQDSKSIKSVKIVRE